MKTRIDPGVGWINVHPHSSTHLVLCVELLALSSRFNHSYFSPFLF